MVNIDIDSVIGEYVIPGEADIIDRYVEIFNAHFRKHYEGKDNVTQRAIHAKSHGLLRASLEIFDHGDTDLQYGIFSAPATYESLVRISNGDGPAGPDTNKITSIGFAIKVRSVVAEKIPRRTDRGLAGFPLHKSTGLYCEGCSRLRSIDACH